MTKYDERFKLKAVRHYLSGEFSYREVAGIYGIEFSQLRRWVSSYQAHGRSGLMGKVSQYSASFKLEVLHRAQRDGLSDRQVAALYDIRCTGHIGKWRSQYDAGGLGALEPRRRGRKPVSHIHSSTRPTKPDEERTQKELLEEVACLRAENAYLKKLQALIEAEQTAALEKKRKWSKD